MDKKLYDSEGNELSLNEILNRLPFVTEIRSITRVEVICKGRSYLNWKKENNVAISFQDNLRTLKVFITDKIN